MSIQDRQGNYQKYNSDGSTPVMVVGSLAQLPDIITTSTVVTAGANTTIGDGSTPFIVKSKQIAIGIRLTASVKFQVRLVFYPVQSNTNAVGYPLVIDHIATASLADGAVANCLTSKFKVQIYNNDVTDTTITNLSRCELY